MGSFFVIVVGTNSCLSTLIAKPEFVKVRLLLVEYERLPLCFKQNTVDCKLQLLLISLGRHKTGFCNKSQPFTVLGSAGTSNPDNELFDKSLSYYSNKIHAQKQDGTDLCWKGSGEFIMT